MRGAIVRVRACLCVWKQSEEKMVAVNEEENEEHEEEARRLLPEVSGTNVE